MKTFFAILYPGIYILCMILLVAIVYNVLWLSPVSQLFSDAKYIRNYMKKPQTFWDLPEPVKKVYLYELRLRDSLKERDIVNLDSSKVDLKLESLNTPVFIPSKELFIIGKKKFILPHGKETSPFVLYKKSLYYLIIAYVDIHKIEYAEYGVINLEKYLDY